MSAIGHKSFFLNAIGGLFERLAKAAILRGVSHQELSQLFRDATLRAAEANLRQHKKKVTTTALHAATGIHRKEISRWQKQNMEGLTSEETDKAENTGGSAAARVVAHWISHTPFLDPKTKTPLALTFEDKPGRDFVSLVEDVGPEVRARGVLTAMLASGLVKETEEGAFELQVQAYLPVQDGADAYGFLSANVGDHLSAALENTLPPDVGADDKRLHFERVLYHSGLSQTEVSRLQEEVEDAAMDMLKKMLARVNKAEARDLHAEEEETQRQAQAGTAETNNRGRDQKMRFRLGVYAYNTPANDADLNFDDGSQPKTNSDSNSPAAATKK